PGDARVRIGDRLPEDGRGDLPRDPPPVLAPAALAFLAAVADDRVPVAVRLFLVGGEHLEGKGLAVPERRRAAVESDAGNAQHGEVDRQYVALLAGRVVARGAKDLAHGRVGEGRGIEAGRFLRVAVVPEADGIGAGRAMGRLLVRDPADGRALPWSVSRNPRRCRGVPR